MNSIFQPADFQLDYLKKVNESSQTWDSEGEIILKFKDELYKRLKRNTYCPYCRRELNRKKEDQMDHIIPKSSYASFTFQTKNIVLACKRCNNKKLAKNVLNEEYSSKIQSLSWDQYPMDSEYYKIVHPYIDIYSDYIDIVNDIFYLPHDNKEKGKNTIKMMKLTDFDFVEGRARECRVAGSIIKKYLLTQDNDKEMIAWAEFVLARAELRNAIFDILIDFEEKKEKAIIINFDEYNSLKKTIINDEGKLPSSFKLNISSNIGFVRKINKLGEDNIDEVIKHLENLYNIRNLIPNCNYTLFLSILILIRQKQGCYNKENIKKYI